MQAASSMISLDNVTKRFGSNEVLKGINLQVQAGEKLVIIGPSGSGKSTLIRLMNGLEEATSGHVSIDGHAMTHRHRAKLNREYSSMVFQQFNLYPHMTVLENLILAPMKLKGVSKEDAVKCAMENLKRVGLEEKANAYPTTLSGGQQQRIAIARALTMKSSIVFFDEPTSALDPEMVKEVLDIMEDLSKDNMHHGGGHPRNGLCPEGCRPDDLLRRRQHRGRGRPGAFLHPSGKRAHQALPFQDFALIFFPPPETPFQRRHPK